MTSGQKGQKSGQSGDRKGDAARAERLRAALRENLKRRKLQARRPDRGRSRLGPRFRRICRRTSPRIRPIILRLVGQGWGMDRIRIVGGRPLNGTIPISGAKNATLPLMIASLLTDQTLILDNVPRLADVNLLQRILSNHGVDMMVPGKRPGEFAGVRPHHSHRRLAHRRHHGALRSRLQDAGELLGDRAAARAHGRGQGVAAGRLRHRHAAGRSAHHGDGEARRGDRDRRRLCHRPRQERAQGRRDQVPQGDGERHPHRADGGGAGARHDGDRQRRAGARDRRRRRLPQQDGRAHLRHRHLAADRRGRDAARRRAAPRAARPHRDRHLCDGGGDDRRRRAARRRAAGASAERARRASSRPARRSPRPTTASASSATAPASRRST